MDELFSPPGTEWQPVSPSLVRMRHMLTLAVTGAVAVVLLVAALGLGAPAWVWVLGAVVVAVAGPTGWVVLSRNARTWAYAEREEDLYIRHGVMFQRLVVVPYGRMQYVDVHAGPLDQLYRIATVHLHTASPHTSAHIPGLPREEAARLRDRLTALGEAQAAGL